MEKLVDNRGILTFSESLALKAVSLLLALILWITILGFKKEELQANVKFEPLVAPGMVITSRIPKYIQVTLSGPRVLLKDVERKLEPIYLDLRRHRESIVPVAITDDMLGEFPRGVHVNSYTPSILSIRLEEIVEKYLPVKPTLRGSPAKGHIVSRVKVIPAKVGVSGPRSYLEALEFVATEIVDTQGLKGRKEVVVAVEVDATQGFRLSRERVVRVVVTTKKARQR